MSRSTQPAVPLDPSALELQTATAVEASDRLAALAATGLLDSPPEESFDRLTRLAARLLGTPVSLVSLVDRNRQFFKSCLGLPEPWVSRRETPLSHSFCRYVTLGEPLVIEDSRKHPLTRSNPAVRDLGVIAYAGFPVRALDGGVVGSFCVIEHQPRRWRREELELLEDLAVSVSAEVQLRGALLQAQRRTLEAESAAARLRRAEASLQRAVRARDEILSIVSHDLRNPLNTISLAAQLLVERLDAADGQRQLESIRGAVERMDRLVRDLLDIAKIEAQGLSVELRPESPAAIVEEACQAFAELAARRGVRLVTAVAGEAGRVRADRGRVLQVLSNLLANALRFTPEGGEVRLEAEPHGEGRVRFAVIDSGPGLEPGQLEQVFDRFWRADPKRRQGAGLGLAIARGIVEAHGGEIEATSEPGRGATFSFWLPAA